MSMLDHGSELRCRQIAEPSGCTNHAARAAFLAVLLLCRVAAAAAKGVTNLASIDL